MSITPDRKIEVIKEYSTKEGDTGSPRGSGCDFKRADRQSHRASQGSSKGFRLAPRSVDDGRPKAASARLSQAERCGTLSKIDRPPRITALNDQISRTCKGGSAARMKRADERQYRMFQVTAKETEWGGKPLRLESGRIARQADGAVLATLGETVVLATATAARSVRPGQDFFPLTVNYQEKTFAAGKIPGGFFKREGRPSEKETLTSRLIDRPIRPLFPSSFKNETQVITTVLAHDGETDPDIVAMIAASAALTISGVPFLGPIGAARVGYIDGGFILNPTIEQVQESKLDLVVAGTRDAVMMVESEAEELSEDTMLKAVMFGQRGFQPAIDCIIELAKSCAKEPWDLPEVDHSELYGKMSAQFRDALNSAYAEPVKQERVEKVQAVKERGHGGLFKRRRRRRCKHWW